MVNIVNILFKELPTASDSEYLGALTIKSNHLRQLCLTKYLAEINLFNVQDGFRVQEE